MPMGRKILWIEEDSSLREEMGPFLEEKGYCLFPVTSDQEAIELYKKLHNDMALIVADVQHSGSRERRLAELNFNGAMVPFVMFTTKSEAAIAVKLMDFGVRDYMVKPISKARFLMVVNNALARKLRPMVDIDGAEPVSMGVDFLAIHSRSGELPLALEWIRKKVEGNIGAGEVERFLCFANELLLNAHEHGNLKIPEEEKIRLLENNCFRKEVEIREKSIEAKIEISLLVMTDRITVNITDEGNGFNYDKYQNMQEEELLDRIFFPCGRGMLLALGYFDTVEYSKKGKSVTFTKLLDNMQRA